MLFLLSFSLNNFHLWETKLFNKIKTNCICASFNIITFTVPFILWLYFADTRVYLIEILNKTFLQQQFDMLIYKLLT